MIELWLHENRETKLGRPFTYSDLAVESLLTIHEFFRTAYRATEGFGRSFVAMLRVDLAIQDFTSPAKRAARLGIDIDVTKYHGKIDLAVDRCEPHGRTVLPHPNNNPLPLVAGFFERKQIVRKTSVATRSGDDVAEG